MNTSLEQWRSACAESQARADALRRQQTSRRVELEHQRRIALAVSFWLAAGLLAWALAATWS